MQKWKVVFLSLIISGGGSLDAATEKKYFKQTFQYKLNYSGCDQLYYAEYMALQRAESYGLAWCQSEGYSCRLYHNSITFRHCKGNSNSLLPGGAFAEAVAYIDGIKEVIKPQSESGDQQLYLDSEEISFDAVQNKIERETAQVDETIILGIVGSKFSYQTASSELQSVGATLRNYDSRMSIAVARVSIGASKSVCDKIFSEKRRGRFAYVSYCEKNGRIVVRPIP